MYNYCIQEKSDEIPIFYVNLPVPVVVAIYSAIIPCHNHKLLCLQ